MSGYSVPQFFFPGGAAGYVNVYQTGTTTPVTCYADGGLSTPISNPITLDANGGCLFYVTGAVNLRMDAYTASGGFIESIDPVYPVGNSTVGKTIKQSINLTVTASNAGNNIVSTTAINLTLPLTTSLSNTFNMSINSQGGAITLIPQSSDAINGGSTGANFVLAKGLSAELWTDANGNWGLNYLSVSSATLPITFQTSTYAPVAADNASEISFFGASGAATWTLTSAATLGAGWYAILNNPTVYNLTLKSSGGTIDGIAAATGYIMYPGEVRMVQCNGTNFFTTIQHGFNINTSTTFTFSVPPNYQTYDCEIWGGGAGGGSGTSGAAGGGGGGAFNRAIISAATMGATTQTCTVGAAGAAGTAGGETSIGTLLKAYGGGAQTSTSTGAGGGGGLTGAGGSVTSTTGGAGGTPAGAIFTGAAGSGAAGTSGLAGGGGAAGGGTYAGGDSIGFGGGGGGGGNSGTAGVGGGAVWGGGGGGGGSSGSSGNAGGASMYGGAGGAGGSNDNAGGVGTAPGGGGGGGSTGGAGAAGAIRIRGIV